MDFRFTEEQEMLASAVRDLLRDLCQPSDLRRLIASAMPRDQNRWDKIVEMGLAGVLVSETDGGLGLKPVDFILAAEACGYFCLPEPLVENAGVALPLLGDFAEGERARSVLRRAVAGEVTVAAGHPVNPFVADADTAGALLLCHDGEVHLLEFEAVDLDRQPSIDPFRRLFSARFTPSASSVVARGDAAAAALTAAADRGALFAAAQLVGIAQRCVDLAVAYAKERHQFGKPIGSYQAIKHHLATATVKIEFAKPVLYAAAAGFRPGDVYASARISQAKLAASEAADLAARTAVQVHGAMGYSWEVDIHFFLKRAIALDTWWGAPASHRGRVATRVFNGRLGPDELFASEAAHG